MGIYKLSSKKPQIFGPKKKIYGAYKLEIKVWNNASTTQKRENSIEESDRKDIK